MNNPTTILVLSASYYHRRVFDQIREIGIKVVATDKNPTAEGASAADCFVPVDITDKKETLEIAKKHDIAGVMAINDFGVPTAAYVADQLDLPGIDDNSAFSATDKGVMRKCWQQAGLPIPKFHIIHSLKDAKNASNQMKFPLVMKPANSGGGGRGVSILSNEGDVEWSYNFAVPYLRDGAIILEEFLDGTELTVEALTFENQTHILAISDKVKPPLRYRVATSLNYPASISQPVLERVTDIVKSAVEVLGITIGASHTELIVTPSGPKLVETGARPGGGHIFTDIVREVCGVNMVQELSKILTGQPPDLNLKHQLGCVYRFFNPPPGQIRKITGVRRAMKSPGIIDLGVQRQEGDCIGELCDSFQRSGFIVAIGKNREEAIQRADLAEIKVVFDVIPLSD
jgi:biotin carboxylase